jgi:hypothetical protein
MLNLYQKWWATRGNPESRKHLVDIYRYLLSQRMIRLISDLHSVYGFVRESIAALEWFFKKMTHQEKPIYLYHAILFLVRRQQIDWEAEPLSIDTPMAEVESLYAYHLAGWKRPMEDYVLDLHTQRGKRNGNCLENFAMEGAYVENENADLLRPEYREIYVMLKQELDLYRNKGLQEQQQRWPLRELACRVGVPIQSLSSKAMARIKKAPHAKLKTAVYKKPVHIVGDLVYKGPYTFDDPRLTNNLRFTYALQVLEERLNLPEWLRTSLPWQCIGYDGNDHYYLVAPNVGKTGALPFEMVSSKLETDVPVVARGGCARRVADVEGNGRLTNEAKLAALQHLYFRFLLGIGDSGTHQILIREDFKTSGRLIAGVDIEERRGVKENHSRIDHLFKKAPSKAQRSLYAPVVSHIRTIGHHHLDQDTLGSLSAVGIDPGNVKKNIEAWEGLKAF